MTSGRAQARAYYNEIDARKAAWLRALIRTGAVADGDVDERSIEDVRAGDLRGYGDAIVAPQAAEFVRAYMLSRG